MGLFLELRCFARRSSKLRQPPIWCFILLLFCQWVWLFMPTIAVKASDPCNPPNLIPQPFCDMDSFHGDPPRQIPDGWSEFVIYGDPTFMNDPHSFFGSGTLRIWSNGGTFKAGIFTQVNVIPGAGYRASIAWGAPNAPDTFGRQLGIDPTGGTDPNSPAIVWGPMHWGDGRILNYPAGQGPNIDIKARALNGTMTVFFVTDHPSSTGDNLIYVDVIALYPDESAPAVEIPPTATSTPSPATVEQPADPPPAAEKILAAAAVIPTDTPLPPTATFTPLPTDTPLPTPTFTPTSTPTPTLTPTPTATPTWTPWPTATDMAWFDTDQAETQMVALAHRYDPMGLMMLGGVSVGGALFCAGTLFWLRRRILFRN